MEMAYKFLKAFFIIIALVAAERLATLIHEAGHLVMGKLSGYRFVSFRIGPAALVRDEGRLRFMKTGNIAGTGGQCIMLPPDGCEPEKTPIVLYYLGGGLFNILTAVLSFVLLIRSDNVYVKTFVLFLGAISAAQAVINLVPLKGTVYNDGFNIRLSLTSPADRITMYRILRISGHPDLSPGQMPEEYFMCQDQGEYAEISRMMRGYYMLDRKEYAEAERLFTGCARSREGLPELYRLEAKAALLLCLLMRGADDLEISSVYDKELQKYLQKTGRYQMDKRCILYAYQLLNRKDEKAAEEEYAAMLKLQDNAFSGDIRMQLSLAEEAALTAEGVLIKEGVHENQGAG